MKRRIIRLGTRGSALARAQADEVAQNLLGAHAHCDIETVIIETSGDRFALGREEKPPVDAAGVKGLFVKEIEQALLEERIDFAVHSAKDLPAQLASGLAIAAYPEREDPRDAFIAKPGFSWDNLPAQATIGTSSLRRKLQILQSKPKAAVVALRGNVDTRLAKLATGGLDAIIVAMAGLRRLGKHEPAATALSADVIVPAPGQGALALEIRAGDLELAHMLKSLDHPRTRLEVECERAFSAAAGGGCSSPLGALAQAEKEALTLRIFWATGENSPSRRLTRRCQDLRRWREFAIEAAAAVAA